MRFSACNIERRSRGVTLIEVIVATTIFSVVMLSALATLNESSDATRRATVQADLRRTGERVLAQIVKDLRSTQVVYTGAASNGTTTAPGNQIEFCKITGFDTANGIPILEGNSAGTTANTIGTTTVIYRYQQGTGNCSTFPKGDKNLGYLQFQRGPQSTYGGTPSFSTLICQELALASDPDWPYTTITGPTYGFEITRSSAAATALPGLVSSGFTFGTYGNQSPPVALRLKLVLKRQTGYDGSQAGKGKKYAWVTVDTMVELRCDQSF